MPICNPEIPRIAYLTSSVLTYMFISQILSLTTSKAKKSMKEFPSRPISIFMIKAWACKHFWDFANLVMFSVCSVDDDGDYVEKRGVWASSVDGRCEDITQQIFYAREGIPFRGWRSFNPINFSFIKTLKKTMNIYEFWIKSKIPLQHRNSILTS